RARAVREHVDLARERSVQEREVGPVALLMDAERLLMRLLVVQTRVEIGAAGEQQSVQGLERLLHSVFVRWDEQGTAARTLDGADVVDGNERGLELPVAPLRGGDIRRDPDQGPSHARTGAPARNRSRLRRTTAAPYARSSNSGRRRRRPGPRARSSRPLAPRSPRAMSKETVPRPTRT